MRSNDPSQFDDLVPTEEEFWEAVEEHSALLFNGHLHPLLDGIPYPYSCTPEGVPRTSFLIFRFPDTVHPGREEYGNRGFAEFLEQAAARAAMHGPPAPPAPPTLDQRYIINSKAAKRLSEYVFDYLLHGRAYATRDPEAMYDAIDEGTLLLRAIVKDRATPVDHFSGLARMHAAYMIYWLWHALQTERVCCAVPRPDDPVLYRQEVLRMVLDMPTWNPMQVTEQERPVDMSPEEYHAFCAFIGCEGFHRPKRSIN